jgi:hypothetical protein
MDQMIALAMETSTMIPERLSYWTGEKPLHQKHGGDAPCELSSQRGNVTLGEMNGIGVTHEPGMAGSLLVGLFAKNVGYPHYVIKLS